MNDTDRLVAHVCDQIRAHLAVNTGASDTIAGIERWWIGKADSVPPAVLKRALRHLVEQGWLVRKRRRDGVVRYTARTGRFQ